MTNPPQSQAPEIKKAPEAAENTEEKEQYQTVTGLDKNDNYYRDQGGKAVATASKSLETYSKIK